MSGPWEKYTSLAPIEQGPWSKYQEQKTPEPTTAETLSDVGESGLRGFNKGLAQVVSAPYRALDWAGEKLTGGDFLPNVEDMSLWKPYLQQPTPKTTAGKYAGAAGEAVGASAIPTGVVLGQAPKLAALAPTTVPRAFGQSIGQVAATSPGAVVAADIASSVGSGLAQEGAQRQGFGPVGQTVAGVAGALAPTTAYNVIAPRVAQVGKFRANADPYERINKGLGDVGIDELADSVAVGATRVDLQNSRRALDILGEEMVRHGGDRVKARNATIARIEQDGVSPSAARDQVRRVERAHEESNLLFGEYPAVAGSNFSTRLKKPGNIADMEAGKFDEVGTQQILDYIANSGSMASSQNVRKSIANRAAELFDSTMEKVAALAPDQKTIDDVADMQAQALAKARAAYDNVYNAPGGTKVDNAALHQGLQNVVNKYSNIAAGRAGENADAINAALKEFNVNLPNGQTVILPSLQMAQDMRGTLRGMIEAANRSGRSHIVNSLQPLYDDVTAVLTKASPEWATANRQWADLKLDEMAASLGDTLKMRASPRQREQIKEYRALAPEAKEIIQVHFTQQLLDSIENAYKLGGSKNLGELFSRASVRNLIREIYGDEKAVQVVRMIRDANVMARSRDAMKGSPTHIRKQVQQEQDADTDALAAVENLDWKDWKKAAFEFVRSAMREKRNKVMGKALTTPMTDTASVAEILERMRKSRAVAARYAQPRLDYTSPSGLSTVIPRTSSGN